MASTASLPETMKLVRQPDPKSTNLILTQGPLPSPKDQDDHIVRVHAAAPCKRELTWPALYADLFPPGRDWIPCTECAGTVVTAPEGGDSPFTPGTEVYFRVHHYHTGNLREFTIAKTYEMARKPGRLSWIEAAATPLSALTAFQGLFRHGDGVLDPAACRGDEAARQKNATAKVLITGASGAVGSWAVQLAAAAGVGTIVAVCGPTAVGAVKQLGATEVVDYSKQTVAEWAAEAPRDIDLVLDVVGGDTLAGAWTAVKEGGVILSVSGSQPDQVRPENAKQKRVRKSLWYLVEPSGTELAEVARLIDAGQAFPQVDSVFELAEFQAAFDKVENGRTKGKVVIKVRD